MAFLPESSNVSVPQVERPAVVLLSPCRLLISIADHHGDIRLMPPDRSIGDPLKNGKLDLRALRQIPTPDEWSWAEDFIARRNWREAVTYGQIEPHEDTIGHWDVNVQTFRTSIN